MISEVTKAPEAVLLVSPQTVAQQEFEDAFGLRGVASKKWGAERRRGLNQVTDELSRWVNSEVAAGRHPNDANMRDHLSGRGGILQRLDRKTFLFWDYGPQNALEARRGGRAEPSPVAAAPAPAPPPPPPPAVGTRIPSEQVTNPKTGKPYRAGMVFEVQQDGKLRRVE